VWLGNGTSGSCGDILINGVPAGTNGVPPAIKGLPKGTPLLANIYPFWSDCTVNQAVGTTPKSESCLSFEEMWKQITAPNKIPNHPVIVGETGWPSGGSPSTNPPTVTPVADDANSYWSYIYDTFMTNSQHTDVTLFAFEAFDEPLKSEEGTSPDLAHYWGMSDQDGNAKSGRVFPLDNSVTAQPARGAYVQVVVTNPGIYEAVKDQIKVSNGVHQTYSFDQWFPKVGASGPFVSGYPWFTYSTAATPVEVGVSLPAVGAHPAATCSNELQSGHLLINDTSLQWKKGNGGTDPCNLINWANNGIFLP
jgi:hypothetical protein